MKDNKDNVWLKDMMSIYNQVSPIVEDITEVKSDRGPVNLESILAGHELFPPVLQSIKTMPQPSNKELRKVKFAFEETLEWCIKAGEMAIKLYDDRANDARLAFRTHNDSMVGFVRGARNYHELLEERLIKIGVNS